MESSLPKRERQIPNREQQKRRGLVTILCSNIKNRSKGIFNRRWRSPGINDANLSASLFQKLQHQQMKRIQKQGLSGIQQNIHQILFSQGKVGFFNLSITDHFEPNNASKGSSPAHHTMFLSISSLYQLDAIAPASCDDHKCLQTLPKVP